MVKPNASIMDLVHQIVARDVARGFELARSLGYQVPKEYDVGLKYKPAGRPVKGLHADGQWYLFTIRVSEVRRDVRVYLPEFNGRQSLRRVSDLWERVMTELHRAASMMAHYWIDAHPEAIDVESAKAALEKLDAMLTNPDDEAKLLREAESAMRHARYEVKGAGK